MSTAPKIKRGSTAPVTKIYRLALYGRKSSGKTCILAALAMDRVLNQEGFTCTWLRQPSQAWLRASAQAEESTVKDITIAFEAGRVWLEDAIGLLEHGATPPGNPNQGGLLRFAYEFTADDHRVYRVELTDYSGELIDPALDSDISPLAGKLRQHMKKMDAILVLAEAPAPGRPSQELHRELGRLRQAFAALRGENQTGPAFDTPVVLLINKWDRRKRAGRFTAERGQDEVRDFFEEEPEPPHRTLQQALKNAVNEGDFRCCPMSAFGPGTLVDAAGKERPGQVDPMLSYGLEDGFVWAARQRDRVDVERLEQWTDSRGWWKLWQMGGEAPPEAANLPNRFPKKSEQNRRVRRGLRRAWLAGVGRVCLLMALLSASVLGAEATLDYQSHQGVKVTLANPGEADAKQLERAEGWLEAYARSPSWRHTLYSLSYGRGKALEEVTAVRKSRDDQSIKVVRAAAPEAREALARKMLESLPNTSYWTELQGYIAEAERVRNLEANKDAIARVNGALKQLIGGKVEDPDAYLVVQKAIADLPPHKEAVTDEIQKGRDDLVAELNGRLAEIQRLQADRKEKMNLDAVARLKDQLARLSDVEPLEKLLKEADELVLQPPVSKDAQDRLQDLRLQARRARDEAVDLRGRLTFKRVTQQLLAKNQFADAARMILDRKQSNPCPEVAQLEKELREVILPQLTVFKDKQAKEKQWPEAKKFLSNVRSDRYIQEVFKEEGTINEIVKLELAVDQAYDDHLYAKLRSDRTEENCEIYLEKAPLRVRKDVVEGYLNYLKKMKGTLDLKLVFVSLTLPNNAWKDYDNDLIVTHGKKTVIYEKASALGTRAVKDIGSCTIKAKLDEKIPINVSSWVQEKYPKWIAGTLNGMGTYHDRASNLVGKEKTITLSRSEGNNTGEAVICIDESSLPKEPPLPE